MSIEAVAWALNVDVEDPVAKLVLIGIANHADRFGENAYPSQETLGQYACVSRQTVVSKVKTLENLGLIRVERRARDEGAGRGRAPNRYSLPLDDLSRDSRHRSGRPKSHRGDKNRPLRSSVSANATTEDRRGSDYPDVGMTAAAEQKRARKRDPVWDSLAAIFGEPTTKTEKTHRGKLVREVRAALQAEFGDDAASSPESRPGVELLLRDRRNALARHWGDRVFVTGDALVKHWTLAKTLVETGRPDSAETLDAKIAKWVATVGVRMDDPNDVRGFLMELSRGDEGIVRAAFAGWEKLRKERGDGSDAAA